MKFYTSYDRPPRCPSPSGGVSATVQDFAKECDINEIVKRAQRTGTLPVVPQDLQFGDAPNETLQETMNRLSEIKGYFESLPSDLRLRFGNNAMAFAAWASDPANKPDMARLGLIEASEFADVTDVPASAPAAPVGSPEDVTVSPPST